MRRIASRLGVLAIAFAATTTAAQVVAGPAATALPPVCEVDCPPGGGGGGGGGQIPPFTPPPRPYITAPNVPLYAEGVDPLEIYECEQVPHVWVSFSNDVTRGTTLYPTGVVVEDTKASFGFYNPAGQLVKTHVTNPARDNCVIHHEPEAFSTSDLAPGYYFVYASYWSMSPYRIAPPDYSGGYAVSHVGRYVTVIRVR
jgi:hypothetical protein